ncbi:MAG: prenyltransferase/squalene oxidase repeat-containing protein [Candidatus Solibacter sp.]
MLAELFLQSALTFLAREVPRWERENHCYSCHNNGDAARALYLGRQKGYTVPNEAISGTTEWLLNPSRWDEIHGAPAASDKNLARIQFTAALTEAVRTGAVQTKPILASAAAALIKLQSADGSWKVDTGGLPGAPATYGTALATYLSRRSLEMQKRSQFEPAIKRATLWLSTTKPESIVDAAALLLAQPERADCRQFLLQSQTSDGGWGAQPRMPAEAFDTAMVLLALKGEGPAAARGRALLIKMQEEDGGWPETTRPSGSQSYAERISTTGWVVYALLETASGKPPP